MDIALRAVVLYTFVFVVLRVVGRRELSSLEPFDLILLVVVGDALQQGLVQDDYSVTGAVIAVATIATMQFLTSYLGFRVGFLQRVFEGEPIVVVQNGSLVERNLRRERITADEVAEEARQQQIASLDDIEWAVLETSGKISFVKRERS